MESIRDYQIKAIEMLKDFDKFCEQNDLRYFVIGGALIGAVRHSGPIPWDDDIDVFMPRPDYEKLHEIWNDTFISRDYTMCRTDDKVNYRSIVTLMKDNNTTFINEHSQDLDIHHGYMLDIIPIDGAAPTSIRRFFQKIYASLFSVLNAQRLPDNQGELIRFFTKLIYTIFRSERINYKIWKWCEKQMSKYNFDEAEYITELTTGFKYMKLEYPKEIFSDYVMLPFSDYQIKAPVGYEQYLSMAFGNYMEFPPVEERVPKHNVFFSDLSKSYLNYRGIKYFNGEK